MDTLTPGYAIARAVLGYVYGQSFSEPIIPMSSTHKSVKRNTSLLITTDAQSIFASGSVFKLFPNPASDELTIQYGLGQNAQDAYVELLDEVGNRVTTWRLSSSQTEVKENISNFATGFYLYDVVINGKIIQRGKLIITR